MTYVDIFKDLDIFNPLRKELQTVKLSDLQSR